jgi:uncharacterized damage-inducible protein DinB
MHNSATLLDLHERGQRSLRGLLAHCAELGPEEFERELAGFGYASVRLQLEHVIGAQEYWLSVIQGRFRDDPEETACPTIEAVETYRRRVAATIEVYLRQATEEELNTAREMWTWPGKMRELVPALVLLRTLTHIYQHQGQVLAMCRLLGKPGPSGLDFPLD